MKNIKIKLRRINLGHDGFHFLIKVKIDQKPCLLVLDTGASRTVLDANWFKENFEESTIAQNTFQSTGFGASDVVGGSAQISTFRLHKNWVHKLELALLDLQNIETTYRNLGISNVVGVLGCDVLVNFNATIKIGKNFLTLHEKST